MFAITQEEYGKIMSILYKKCLCNTPIYDCVDNDCDISKIDEILSRHIEVDYSVEEDKLPF